MLMPDIKPYKTKNLKSVKFRLCKVLSHFQMLAIHSLQGCEDIQRVQSWLTSVVWSEKGYLGHFEPPGKPCSLIGLYDRPKFAYSRPCKDLGWPKTIEIH